MTFLAKILGNMELAPARAKVIEIRGTEKRPVDGIALLERIARARAFVRKAGVRPGDRVALLAPNSVDWITADLGAISAGATLVPLYDRQEPGELAVMLRSAEPELLIASSAKLADAIKVAWPEHKQVATFDDVFATEPDPGGPFELPEDHTVAIIYTSGTSGVPKGVMLSRANMDFMIPNTIARLDQTVGPRKGPDEVFHFLPFCFAAARMMLWTQLSRPNPIMISTDLTNLVQEIGTARPHYFLNVPAVLERIRNGVTAKAKEKGGLVWSLYAGGFDAYKRVQAGTAGFVDRVKLSIASTVVYSKVKDQIGPNLEFVISGSAPLSEDTQQWFRMLGIGVYQAYGLTETTGIVSLDDPERVVPGRVGFPLDGVECKLGEGDELMVRGPNLFAGYWRMPQETANAMRDGWFRTGDQVEIDGGNLRIVGRIKNLIIPESGHNISPEPIEEKFMEYCSEAEQCMLVGHGKPFIGILVTGEPVKASVEAAIERINGEVPHYRKIRKFHLTSESFSVDNGLLTANQKLRRRVIEDHFSSEIDELYV